MNELVPAFTADTVDEFLAEIRFAERRARLPEARANAIVEGWIEVAQERIREFLHQSAVAGHLPHDQLTGERERLMGELEARWREGIEGSPLEVQLLDALDELLRGQERPLRQGWQGWRDEN